MDVLYYYGGLPDFLGGPGMRPLAWLLTFGTSGAAAPPVVGAAEQWVHPKYSRNLRAYAAAKEVNVRFGRRRNDADPLQDDFDRE